MLVSTTTNIPATSDPVRLYPGKHNGQSGQLCLLEAAAVLAGEPLTDHPRSVSPVVCTLGIRLNDLGTHRQRQTLTRFLPDLVGTAGDGKEDARMWVALDHSVRTVWPRWVDRFGMGEEAAALWGLAPITGEPAYSAARPLVAPIIDELTRLRRRRRDGSSAVLGSSVVVDRVGLVDAGVVAIAQASDRTEFAVLAAAVRTAAAVVVARTSPSALSARAALQGLMWADAAALFARIVAPAQPLPGYTGPEPHTSLP